MQTVQPHKTNGVNGSPGLHQFHLDIPGPDSLLRQRSASPSLGGQEEQTKLAKKHKGKFNMFRLHKHKNKSKKYPKESEEAMMLSQSDGSSLLQQKLHQQRPLAPNRRSFSGHPNRSISPAGSTHSFPGFMESEGESEEEFLKTLINPTGRSPSPSPLLLRTPTPNQQYSSMESDGGQPGPAFQVGDSLGGQGDNVSLTASHLDGSNLVSCVWFIFTKLFGHIKRQGLRAQSMT